MSHSHSHAPGEEHSHSHGPGENHSHSHGPPQPQQMMPPPPDPVMQAIIDASFKPVDLVLAEENSVLLCGPHKLEKCDSCNVDYASLNRISRLLINNPNLLCPPPAKVVNPQMSQAINKTKDEGNALFKSSQYVPAIQRYSMAASIAVQRPAWEIQQIMREELSAILSNRSAAQYELGDYIGALVDADHVITLKRNWGKGHFRKAKALLGMGRFQEAKEALDLGLAFDPGNAEMSTFRDEIDARIKTETRSKSD